MYIIFGIFLPAFIVVCFMRKYVKHNLALCLTT